MEFCTVCENLLYLESSDDKLIKRCKKCGHSESADGSMVFSTTFEKKNHEFTINPYTKLDPTLPRIYTIPCPNEACENHDLEGKRVEIISIRYDNVDLKYMYLCPKCDTSWKPSKN